MYKKVGVIFLSLILSELSFGDENIESVSMMQLIVNPEKYANHTVDLRGYMSSGFESTVLWFHQEDAKCGNLPNSLWLSFNNEEVEKYKEFNASYVRLIGVFKPSYKGHLSMYPGSINVLRIMNIEKNSKSKGNQ